MKIIGIVMLILISGSAPLSHQNSEIKEESPLSKTENVSAENHYIFEVRHVYSNNDMSMKDWAPLIIAVFASLTFILNLKILRDSLKNRKSDKENEKFLFWTKDIIYPQYISPLLSEIRVLSDLYSEVAVTDCQIQKDTFLDYWTSHKKEIKRKVRFGTELPYFSYMYLEINKKINTIEDEICYRFYSDEILNVGDSSQLDYIVTRGDDLNASINPFEKLHDYIINSIHKTQRSI